MTARVLVAWLAGLLFGLGLAVSQMVNPAKVLNFLDVAGTWDPTLALVMGGALLVTIPAFRIVLRRPAPLLDGRFHLPSRQDIDRRLLIGAGLFGIGWGIGGLCPGPALVAVLSGLPDVLAFVAAMVLGHYLVAKFA